VADEFDPFDAAQVQHAWPLLAELRRRSPVVTVAGGMRYVSTYDECRDVLRDASAFSNASGFKAPGVVVPAEDRLLGELDPPRHTVVRRVVTAALTPRIIKAAEPFIHDTAAALLGRVRAPGPADLVAAFTVPLPNRVTVHLLGLPPEDADQLAAWAKELMESTFPATNSTPRGEGFAAAFPEFAGYIDAHIDRAAAALGRDEGLHDEARHNDVLSRLLLVEDGGGRLDRRQVRALVRNLITGGLTTTSQLLGNLIDQVLSVPGLDGVVRSGPSGLDRAIEESLRLSPPVLFVPRGCVRDFEVGAATVRAGERVIVGTASANRDERRFSDGEAFDADRANSDAHLTFGHGPHLCPGAGLARAVARAGLAAFIDRFPPGGVRLVPGYEFENVPTFFECGPRRLPVLIDSS